MDGTQDVIDRVQDASGRTRYRVWRVAEGDAEPTLVGEYDTYQAASAARVPATAREDLHEPPVADEGDLIVAEDDEDYPH